jgi:hypothetical protein
MTRRTGGMKMDEYISREDYCEENCGKENREGYKECTNCGMLNVPTADVQPVKHGKWNSWGRDTAYNKFYRCSCCNYEISMDVESREFDDSLPKYCLNCGARMDLKDGDVK